MSANNGPVLRQYSPNHKESYPIEEFGFNWLNKRLLPLPAAVAPTVPPFKRVRVAYYTRLLNNKASCYVSLTTINEGDRLHQGAIEIRGTAINDTVIFKRDGRETDKKRPVLDHDYSDFTEGVWEIFESSRESLEPFGDQYNIGLYNFPRGRITLQNEVKNKFTQFEIMTNSAALLCMRRVLSQQWQLRPLTVKERHFVKPPFKFGSESQETTLKSWSSVEVRRIKKGTVQVMQATYDGDSSEVAALRLGDDGSWQDFTGSVDDSELSGSDTNKIKDSKIYELYYDNNLNNITPTIWVRRPSIDGKPGHLLTVVAGSSSGTSPDDPVGVRHIRHAIEKSNGADEYDDDRWIFQRCFKIKTGTRGKGKDDEPRAVDQPAVKLFVRRMKGVISDRMVVKTATRTRNWDEVDHHRKLTALDKQNCIIPLRGWSLHTKFNQNLHMYIDYAPYGSLHDLVRVFHKKGKLVPEIFIWLVIRNLVRACAIMEKEGWVNPDIKFDNVFLGIPNGSDDFPAYCNPMLGDFGLIYDIMNPPGQLCGTIGWLTYEQFPAGSGRPFTKLHVQAIGIIAWALWCRSTSGTQRTDFGRTDANQLPTSRLRIFPRIEPRYMLELTYSSRLRKLIVWCMERELAARPTLHELGEIADEAIASLTTNRFLGLDKLQEPELPERMQLDLKAEGWPVGGPVSASKHRIPEGTQQAPPELSGRKTTSKFL